MTQLGVFRDDFYNPVNVLTNAQYNATAQASGVLTAAVLAGAVENYILSSGATALTTDTGANIVANLQTCIIAQLKASGALAAGSSGSPPAGVPNLTNLTFYVAIENTNGGTLTLTAGTGVTFVGAATIATVTTRSFLVTVTSPTTVSFQTLGAVATTA